MINSFTITINNFVMHAQNKSKYPANQTHRNKCKESSEGVANMATELPAI